MSGASDRVAVGVDAVWPEDVDSDEGVVIAWFVREGWAVEEDESLCEVQVEKVSFDVYAPADGELIEIVRTEDEEFERRDVLGWIEPDGGG